MPLDEVGLKAVIEGYSAFNSQVTQMAQSMANVDKTLTLLAQTSVATAAKQDTVSQSTKKLADGYGGVTQKAITFNQVSQAANKVMDIATKIYDATAKKAMDYGVQVRGLAMYTGMSTEETSKLIQVSDDLKVEFGTLEMAAKFMFKNGLQPSVETLAKLSDQYLAISDPLQKAEFLTKQFGRAGIDMAEAMNKGGAAIRAMAADINPALILTKEQAQAAEDARAAQDNFNDAIMAVSVSLGNSFLPALTALIPVLIDVIEYMGKGVDVGFDLIDMMSKMPKAYDDANVAAQKTSTSYEDYLSKIRAINGAMPPMGVAIRAVSEYQWMMVNSTKDISKEQDNWVKIMKQDVTWLDKINNGIVPVTNSMEQGKFAAIDYSSSLATLPAGMSTVVGAAELAAQALKNLADQQENNKKQIDKIKASFSELTKEMVYNRLAAFLDAEGQLALARQMGLLNEKTYSILTQIDALTKEFDKNGDGALSASEKTLEYQNKLAGLLWQMQQIQSKDVTITVDVEANMPDWLKRYLTPGGNWTPTPGGGTGTGGGGSGWTDPKTGIWYPKKPAGMAGGGMVTSGELYRVNERGGEWFRPQSNGIIIPNNVVRNYSNSIANKNTVNKNYNLSVITNQSQSAVTSSFGIMRLIG